MPTPPIQKKRAPLGRPRTLIEEAEVLVKKMIRQTRMTRTHIDADGNKTLIRPDPSDMAKAAKAAFDLIMLKNKIEPKEMEGEFVDQLRAYHGARSGDADDTEDDPGAASGATAH